MLRRRLHNRSPLTAAALSAGLLLAACGSTGADTVASATDGPVVEESTTTDAPAETGAETTDAPADATTTVTTEGVDADDATDTDSASSPTTSTTASADPVEPSAGCEATAALFVTRGSANADLPDPEVEATCAGDTINVVSNGVPDYTYIGTSPGAPDGREFTFSMPAEPTMAAAPTDIPYIGPIGMTLGGISIYGPTEGTGGDVDSLPGIISVCGSHNGPGGFHTHKILASEETDCFFTPEEVAAAPQLAGYAFDGFPIYTGVDQFTSSWQLTDESLFASDTWAAHTYVEGSGDLDQCNGRYDENGDYAYYTTETFPYLLGCFMGEVEVQEAGGGGGDRPEPPEGSDDADRPEPPEGDAAAGDEDRPERPERPEGDEDGDRPAPPDAGEDGDRPAPPDEGADA